MSDDEAEALLSDAKAAMRAAEKVVSAHFESKLQAAVADRDERQVRDIVRRLRSSPWLYAAARDIVRQGGMKSVA